ncbi:MAG: SDR family oxidoreductase, partial [Nakamurella sp.]
IVLDISSGVDAADPASVREFLDESAPQELRGVVALAGAAGAGGIDDTDIDDWHSVLRANLDTAYVVVRESLSRLRAESGDRGIVLMSSVNGRHGGNTLSGPAYATAKAGLIGLTRHLASTLAPSGIRANAIAPGPVETAMYHRLSAAQQQALVAQIPLHRTLAPTEVAGAITFLLSDAARSITGAVLDMNGGLWMG